MLVTVEKILAYHLVPGSTVKQVEAVERLLELIKNCNGALIIHTDALEGAIKSYLHQAKKILETAGLASARAEGYSISLSLHRALQAKKIKLAKSATRGGQLEEKEETLWLYLSPLNIPEMLSRIHIGLLSRKTQANMLRLLNFFIEAENKPYPYKKLVHAANFPERAVSLLYKSEVFENQHLIQQFYEQYKNQQIDDITL